jgi:Delta7-sterol 5-desaturase
MASTVTNNVANFDAAELGHFERFESYIPFDLTELSNFALASLVVSFIVAFRYFLVVTPVWWSLYKIWPNSLKDRQIYEKLPTRKMQAFEIKWSIITSLIFGVGGVALGWVWQMGWTKIYLKFDDYPVWYIPLSFLLMALIHDFYFYVTHLLMHQPRFYRLMHATHHQSITPSPWASFSFHPLEGLVQAAIVPILVMIVPVHPTVILVYLTFMTVSAIINHLGFEVLPQNKFGVWLARWFITGTHHAQHHRFFKTNYALFFTIWDRVFHTEDPRFEKEIAGRLGQLPSKAKESQPSPLVCTP